MFNWKLIDEKIIVMSTNRLLIFISAFLLSYTSYNSFWFWFSSNGQLKSHITSFYPLRSRAQHDSKKKETKKVRILPPKKRKTTAWPHSRNASCFCPTSHFSFFSRPSPRIPRPRSTQVDRLAPRQKHLRPLCWPVPGPWTRSTRLSRLCSRFAS